MRLCLDSFPSLEAYEEFNRCAADPSGKESSARQEQGRQQQLAPQQQMMRAPLGAPPKGQVVTVKEEKDYAKALAGARTLADLMELNI